MYRDVQIYQVLPTAWGLASKGYVNFGELGECDRLLRRNKFCNEYCV
ncbi:hypothetical protein QUB60_12300 [Microcoleus sp. A2-C5]